MPGKSVYFPVTIEEKHLDVFGHMNNAMYLELFEAARWDLINRNGYGIDKIKATGLGPVILKITMTFSKEILLNDQIDIETCSLGYQKKIGIIQQRMLRDQTVCAEAEFTVGLLDLKARKLVTPTAEWLAAQTLV